MEELSAQAKVNLADTYSPVIRDVKNLEQFYDAKVLAINSKHVSEITAVHFGSKPTKPIERTPQQQYMYGNTSSDDSDDGSFIPGLNDVPDTPLPKTPRQAKIRMRGMWGNPPSVHGNGNYPSSVLNKDSYL